LYVSILSAFAFLVTYIETDEQTKFPQKHYLLAEVNKCKYLLYLGQDINIRRFNISYFQLKADLLFGNVVLSSW